MNGLASVTPLNGRNKVIDITKITHEKKGKRDRCSRKILTSEEYTNRSHHADYIDSEQSIDLFIRALYDNGRIDSAVLFVIGVNTGIRPVDILSWRWKDLMPNGRLLKSFGLVEQKTGKTTIVNLNQTASKILRWYHSFKKENEKGFSEENFVFTNLRLRRKCYVYYDIENDVFWHQDNKHKKMSLMYSYDDGIMITKKEGDIVESDKCIRLQKPIDLDTVSKHFAEAAKTIGLEGHYSSYTMRQTHSYWFRCIAETDDFVDVAKRIASTALLSIHFNHSDKRTTEKHYMRNVYKTVGEIVMKLNLGEDAVDEIVNGSKLKK